MIEILPQFIIAVTVLLVIPGPDMAYCVASGISHGARGALSAAVGVGVGGLVLSLCVALIIFFAGSYDLKFFNFLQVLGSLYLLYLGVSILTAKPDLNRAESKSVAQYNIFLRGMVTNLSNPKALVFFVSFIPQFIPLEAQSPHWLALTLGAVLCAIGTSVNYLFGLAGVSLQSATSVTIRNRPLVDYITAILFITIAVIFLRNYWQSW